MIDFELEEFQFLFHFFQTWNCKNHDASLFLHTRHPVHSRWVFCAVHSDSLPTVSLQPEYLLVPLSYSHPHCSRAALGPCAVPSVNHFKYINCSNLNIILPIYMQLSSHKYCKINLALRRAFEQHLRLYRGCIKLDFTPVKNFIFFKENQATNSRRSIWSPIFSITKYSAVCTKNPISFIDSSYFMQKFHREFIHW